MFMDSGYIQLSILVLRVLLNSNIYVLNGNFNFFKTFPWWSLLNSFAYISTNTISCILHFAPFFSRTDHHLIFYYWRHSKKYKHTTLCNIETRLNIILIQMTRESKLVSVKFENPQKIFKSWQDYQSYQSSFSTLSGQFLVYLCSKLLF